MAVSFVLFSSALESYFLFRHGYTPSYALPFFYLAGVQLLALAIYTILIYPYLLSPLRHLPGPKTHGSLIFGHFLTVFNNPPGEPHTEWIKIPNNGMIRYFGLLNEDRIILTSPELLKEVLHQKCYAFVKPTFLRESVGRILGVRGLLFLEGDEHKHQRKVILPAFSHARIKNLVPTFWKKSRELAEKVGDFIRAAPPRDDGTTVVDMSKWVSLATLDVIGEAGFGYHFRALESATLDGSGTDSGEGGSELAYAYRKAFTRTRQSRILQAAPLFMPGWLIRSLPIQRNADIRECRRIIHKVSQEILQRKRKELGDRKPDTQDTVVEEKDILSTMLQSGDFDKPEDEAILQDEMMTFLAAGHETTSTAVIWALYILSLEKYHHIQSRLREEIHNAFPLGFPDNVTYDEIESLKYLRQVTSEVLRFYPSVPLTIRTAKEDTTVGGQLIPKGTRLMIVPLAINKSQALWGKDADEFKPERWQDDASGGIESNYAFMTFMAGPRGCIGAQFARVEFKCLLAGIVGRYKFSEEEGVTIDTKGGITARPKGGMPLKFKPVEGW